MLAVYFGGKFLTVAVDVDPVEHTVGEILGTGLLVLGAVDGADGLWRETPVGYFCVTDSPERQQCEDRLVEAYLDDVQQLVAVNAAVPVHVVQFEVPAQLVLHLAPHHQAQSGHVLQEVDVAVL